MTDISKIRTFCADPTRNNFFLMSQAIQHTFNKAAEWYILKETGRTSVHDKIATRVHNFYLTRNLNEEQLRGLRSLLLGAKTYRAVLDSAIQIWERMEVPHPKSKMGSSGRTISPDAVYVLVRFDSGDEIGLLPGGPGLENHIMLSEYTKLRQGSEFLFYPGQLKEHLIEFVSEYQLTLKDIIFFYPNGKIQIFYQADLGVIWNQEECIECMELAAIHGLMEGWEVKPDRDWRNLLRRIHPDKGGDKDARFQRIQIGQAKLTAQINDCRRLLVNKECLSDIRHRAAKPPGLESKKKKSG